MFWYIAAVFEPRLEERQYVRLLATHFRKTIFTKYYFKEYFKIFRFSQSSMKAEQDSVYSITGDSLGFTNSKKPRNVS